MVLSKYTTEVRYICEQLSGLVQSVDYSKIDDVIDVAYTKIFDFDFPIFDEKYKPILCKKLLKHYYFREIGLETYSLWKNFLNVRLNEIMPYYNQMYKSELLEFNPLYDTEMTRVHDTKSTEKGNSDNNSKGTNVSRERYSDTPQGSLSDVENDKYLTTATVTSNDSTGDTKVVFTTDNLENYVESVRGKSSGGNYSKMLLDFRSTFLNIDVKIIEECSDLFMNLW